MIHLSDQDKNNIIKEYRNNNAPVKCLAEMYNVSETTIYNVLEKYFKEEKMEEQKKLELADVLLEEGKSIKSICDILHVDYERFRKKLNRYRKKKAS